MSPTPELASGFLARVTVAGGRPRRSLAGPRAPPERRGVRRGPSARLGMPEHRQVDLVRQMVQFAPTSDEQVFSYDPAMLPSCTGWVRRVKRWSTSSALRQRAVRMVQSGCVAKPRAYLAGDPQRQGADGKAHDRAPTARPTAALDRGGGLANFTGPSSGPWPRSTEAVTWLSQDIEQPDIP